MKEVTIKGWIAKDSDKNVYLYNLKPHRDERYWLPDYCDRKGAIMLGEDVFPDLTWELEPKEVEITIKIKE